MKTKLICFEGPNGVGKSTILNNLKECFNVEGISCRTFKDSEYPEMIEVRKNIRKGVISEPEEIINMVAQARLQVYSKYLDLRDEPGFVLLDRGYYTSAVLQFQKDFSISRIIEKNLRLGIPIPNQTFILMAPLDVLIKRISERARDGFVGYSSEFLNRQRTGYLEIAKNYEECKLIDNSGKTDPTIREIRRSEW